MASGSRFCTATDIEIEALLENRHSKKTKNVISSAVRMLEAYINHIGMHTLADLNTIPVDELDKVMKHFYVDVRKHDGEKYTKKSMVTNRFGLQKHFLKHRNIDIINDKLFQASNDTFKAVLVNLKQEGKGSTKHKDIISDEDLEKLYQSGQLSMDTPATLQNKVFFDYMLYFCNRGRENLRETLASDFEIKIDGSGRKYVSLAFNRQTKNHRGDDLTDDDVKGGAMYELQGDPLCPVRSFEKYISHLNPQCDVFWQRPKSVEKIKDYSTVWYDNVAVGRNTLGDKMKSLSIECSLSKIYTNHCIRATCISILDEAGISDRHICGISGHKSVESLKIYKSKLSDKKKRSVSSLLCEKLTTNERSVLPTEFSVENISEGDINTDPDIQDFLSPSQEDRDLASINDTDMVDVNQENVPVKDSSMNKRYTNTKQIHTDGSDTITNKKLENQSSVQAQHNTTVPGMHVVSYGTVNVHYHYH